MSQAADAPLFEALIVPHRSLSKRALNRLLIGICLLCSANASVFVAIGAWPVAGFTGIELLLAAVLFRSNVYSARGSELLLLMPSGLRIRRTSPAGARTETTLPAGWLRVELVERAGTVPSLLLVAHGVREEVGRVLGEAAKRDLAVTLADALHRYRTPVFDNPQLRD